MDGILINEVAGQLTGNAVHETVLYDENGKLFKIGVLATSYMTYINPDTTALVFFFEGAGVALKENQLIEIVAGEGLNLTNDVANVTKLSSNEINDLPEIAHSFKELKRIDTEKLAEENHRASPVVQERLKSLDFHVFADNKPFFYDLSFPIFSENSAPVDVGIPEDTSENKEIICAETIIEEEIRSSNDKLIFLEPTVMPDVSGLFDIHQEEAILVREDEQCDLEIVDDDDDNDGNNNMLMNIPLDDIGNDNENNTV